MSGLSAGHLQDVKEMMFLNLHVLMVGCYSFCLKWTHTIYRANGRAEMTITFYKPSQFSNLTI